MKKQLLFLLITILSINCYSQISFEKGYYVDNSNQKVDCLIKNIDWKNNPTEFEYMLTENSGNKTENITNVKEFGIYNISKYVRSTVKIDRSSYQVKKLSKVRKPVFTEEVLFLKVLIEGKANLYEYSDGSLQRFFYSIDNSKIEQLVFKEYVGDFDNIYENNTYKQQLWNDLKCSNFTMNKLEHVDYNKNELIKFFVEYNECKNQEYTNFDKKEKRDLFNLSIRPGFNLSSLSIQNSNLFSGDKYIDFGSKIGFRLGVEAELIMPFNKNKWAVLMEPTYQYFKSEKKLTSESVKAEYKSVELPVGIRYSLFLNEDSKIFINGSFIVDFVHNSAITYDSGKVLKITSGTNLAFGLGYKRNDRYSLEVRYETNREILSDYVSWGTNYNILSIIFGYSIFNKNNLSH